MKTLKRISAYFVAATMAVGIATAQNYDTGGLIIDPNTVSAFDMFSSAQTQFSMGTARSAAMAGAFTSLGGDLASMSINPAGLGMYRTNEFSITPMMNFSRSKSNASPFEGNAKNRFSLGSVGIVLKLRESSKGVTAINLGFGYTRLADFNYRYSFGTTGRAGDSSIADVFALQMKSSGLTSKELNNNYVGDAFDWGRINPVDWGATLGYLTGAIGDASGVWDRDMIGRNAAVDSYTTVESVGSSGEYDISLGINVNSKLYIGATLGIPMISISRDIYYGEGYRYDRDPSIDYRMDYFDYDQSARLKGTGVNFKIGAIYRPIDGLRIGVALHSPTYYAMNYKYKAGMTSRVKALNNSADYQLDSNGYLNPPLSYATDTLIDEGEYGWKYISPTRLLVGISYTFGERAVISVDYERDWYNGMRVKGSPYNGIYGKGLYKEFFRESFRGSNTLRVGAEVRIIPQVALRAGYGMWAGALRDRDAIFSSPVIRRTDYVGAGVGIAFSRYVSLDATYQYNHNRLTDYKTFYATSEADDIASATYSTTIDKHLVLLTLAFKF